MNCWAPPQGYAAGAGGAGSDTTAWHRTAAGEAIGAARAIGSSDAFDVQGVRGGTRIYDLQSGKFVVNPTGGTVEAEVLRSGGLRLLRTEPTLNRVELGVPSGAYWSSLYPYQGTHRQYDGFAYDAIAVYDAGSGASGVFESRLSSGGMASAPATLTGYTTTSNQSVSTWRTGLGSTNVCSAWASFIRGAVHANGNGGGYTFSSKIASEANALLTFVIDAEGQCGVRYGSAAAPCFYGMSSADWPESGPDRDTGLYLSNGNTGGLSAAGVSVLAFEAAKIGFLGGAAVTQRTSGADLTNNVTAGGTDDTIDNFTDLVVYANDAAAIRNAIYQLARKVKQLNDGLRAFTLFS